MIFTRAFGALCILTIASVPGCSRGEDAPPGQGASRGDIRLIPDTQTIEALVSRNTTLESLFRGHQLRDDVIGAAVQAISTVSKPRALLHANQPYRLVRTLDGVLDEFEYRIDNDKFLRLLCPDRARPHALQVELVPYRKTTEVAALHASIDAAHPSLIAAIDAAGERVQLAIALADIFASDVDFESDLQPGDTVDLLYEKVYREGEFATYGAVVAARLSNDRRDLQAFRFTQNNRPGYYDPNGRSLRRLLLRSPLRFEPRVTSRFSYRRLHPVYGDYRPHLGVDYGAPVGAAVVAVANGVVVSAGYNGGAGLMVHLRHTNGLESLYLHLSSLGKGIHRGARVDQGQIVGRVGSSGTSTGPHLDFRVKRNGAYVNPLTLHRNMPPGEPIAASLRAAFAAERDRLSQQLSATMLARATALSQQRPHPATAANPALP